MQEQNVRLLTKWLYYEVLLLVVNVVPQMVFNCTLRFTLRYSTANWLSTVKHVDVSFRREKNIR